MEISKEAFFKLSRYIHEICGIDLAEEKEYLLRQRLGPVANEWGYKTLEALCVAISSGPPKELKEAIIMAITTNETSFFRDSHPFEMFKTHILPELGSRLKEEKYLASGSGPLPLKIWSAASSTGQEPYSLAMIIHEYVSQHCFQGINSVDFEILATDISSRVLLKAKEAKYYEHEVARGLSPAYKQRYFEVNGDFWTLKDEIKKMVEFRQLNLTKPLSFLGRFDVIFCRNVLIYFNFEMKGKIIAQFLEMLKPAGVLFLGASENLYMLQGFESQTIAGSVIYRKKTI